MTTYQNKPFLYCPQWQKGINMSFMSNYNATTNPIIIGIDHGYGNIKTAHCCFKTGVAAYDKEPTFKSNMLVGTVNSFSQIRF